MKLQLQLPLMCCWSSYVLLQRRIDYVRKYAFGVMAILKNEKGQFPITCAPSTLPCSILVHALVSARSRGKTG